MWKWDTIIRMTKQPKDQQISFRMTADILERLDFIRERDGVPFSEQMRRGLLLYFAQKGVEVEQPETTASGKRSKKVSR